MSANKMNVNEKMRLLNCLLNDRDVYTRLSKVFKYYVDNHPDVSDRAHTELHGIYMEYPNPSGTIYYDTDYRVMEDVRNLTDNNGVYWTEKERGTIPMDTMLSAEYKELIDELLKKEKES